MKKTIAAITTAILAIGLALTGVTTAANATGSGDAVPYTVTTTSLTLPSPAVFSAAVNNDANIKYIPLSQYTAGQTYSSMPSTWTPTTINIHLEGKDGYGLAVEGKSTVPFDNALSGGAFRGTLPSTGYCIVWVQVGNYNEHFGEGGQAPLCTDAPKDAAASVSTTAATCKTAETLVLGAATNATWGAVTTAAGSTPGTTTYSVTATAAANHAFGDGTKTKTFAGTLAGKVTGNACSYTPACIDNPTFSYTYNGVDAGTITVTKYGTATGTLCKPLSVRAATWTYDSPINPANSGWPQTLKGYNDVTVTSLGTVSYQAPYVATCKQNDIYASFAGFGDLTLPTHLTAPNAPHEPSFLHGVLAGFGPTPTYFQSTTAGCDITKPVASLNGGACYYDTAQKGSFKSVTFEYDNRASNVPVDFAVQGDSAYNRTVPAGQVVYVSAPASWTGGVSYTVVAAGQTYSLSIPAYAGCPPTVQTCSTQNAATVSTNLAVNGWAYDETRANGHNTYVSGGLHIVTDGTSDTGARTDGVSGTWNTDKAAGYHALNIPLSQVGVPSIDYTSNSGSLPGIQLTLSKNGDGVADATLVYEGVTAWGNPSGLTGEGYWWSTKPLGTVSSTPAPNPGYQYSWGTLNDYLAAWPNAAVTRVGYSLGSGAQGDGVIHSISVGCDTFTFAGTDVPVSYVSPVTFKDVCGNGDQINIPTGVSGYHYVTDDERVLGVGTVTVTAVADAGHSLPKNGVYSWSHTFVSDTDNGCVAFEGDPTVTPQTCGLAEGDAPVSGYITVFAAAHVSYIIHNTDVPSRANDVTVLDGSTQLPVGHYAVTAVADAGFTLTNVPPTTLLEIVDQAVDCQLPSHAAFTPDVTAGGESCHDGQAVSGFIQITPGDGLRYFVGTTELVAARTAFAPGTYQVTAVAGAGDTVLGTNPVTVVVDALDTSCADLKTLAFTGVEGTAGFLGASAILLLIGAAFIFMKRPRNIREGE